MRIEFGNIVVLLKEITKNPGETKRLAERRCTESLLQEAFGHPVELRHDSTGRPIISEGPISVSHSSRWGAIAYTLDSTKTIGIDIEEHSDRVERVIGRVLRGPNVPHYISGADALMAWTLLEAAFKATNPNEGLTLVDYSLPDPTGGCEGKTITLPGHELTIVVSRSLGEGMPWISVVKS